MGLIKSAQKRPVKPIPCRGCGRDINTTKNAGYVFCHQCGENTRIEKYKRFPYTQKAAKTDKVDKKWVFRDG